MNEPRKASDVLISLENKIDQLISLFRSHDLVLKVLTNKINTMIEIIDDLPIQQDVVNSMKDELKIYNPHSIKSSNDFKVLQEVAPTGFRRNSRPETYIQEEKKPAKIANKSASIPTPPPQTTTPSFNEEALVNLPVQFPDYAPQTQTPPGLQKLKAKVEKPKNIEPPKEIKNSQPQISHSDSRIPVQQRIVDKNGKAIFLANIEIINLETGVEEYKTRTNGMGKYQASLMPGRYKVKINKQESVSKEKIDLTQEILVDGRSSTQELPVLICK